MKKVLVAGAGHGGLVAAIHLAKSGFDVTVIEQKKKENMGHDWHDWIDYSAFDGSGIDRPPEEQCLKATTQGFRNPAGTVMLKHGYNESAVIIDRKHLIQHLISLAEQAGAKLQFETDVVAPLINKKQAEGLIVRKDGVLEELKSDLVIDSAGMYSPIRTKLPASFGIDNTINKRSVFHVYRAYYESLTGEIRDPAYVVDFFHNNRPGIDWIITEKDYVDILIGKFSQAGDLTQDDVDKALAAYRKDYPFLGEKIVRGGSFEDIPITRMLPLLVADGYAAIGDCAGMTVPLNGCGVILSMNAGKILADTLIGSNGDCSKASLWNYEYNYFQKHGKDLVMIDIVKTLFTYVKGSDIDYLMKKKIFTSDLLGVADGEGIDLTAQYILNFIVMGVPMLKLVPAATKCFKTLPVVSLICGSMPKAYQEDKVEKWIKRYRAL